MTRFPRISAASIVRQLHDARAAASSLHVSEALSNYVIDLARATREHPRVSLGLSTRGALALLRAARVHAGLRGGEFVAPDDVQSVARWVLAHRLVLKPEAALDGDTDLGIAGAILDAHGGSALTRGQRS